jgi:acid phosphatase
LQFVLNKMLFLGLTAICHPVLSAESMVFSFELVRHGARTSLIASQNAGFTVGLGELTPSGMRQRALLGRNQRQRYVEEYALLSPTFVEGEVYIQSTDVDRTIQSGYSELLGLYPPGSGAYLMSDGEVLGINSRGKPPFFNPVSSSINS